jgi:hypothetical protein
MQKSSEKSKVEDKEEDLNHLIEMYEDSSPEDQKAIRFQITQINAS